MVMEPYMDYDYSASVDAAANGVAGFLMVFVLLFYLLGAAYSILNYVLYSLGVYTIAKRRGIHHSWLAWLPVGNMWVLGSISDQYQYLAKGRVCGRRKVLLGTSLGAFAAMIPMLVSMVAAVLSEAAASDASETLLGTTAAIMLLTALAISVLSIIMLVFEYIALYDLYASCEPGNGTLYLVLSILLSVTLPFFVFACRNKDLGMPPRRQPQPVYTYEEPAPDPEL